MLRHENESIVRNRIMHKALREALEDEEDYDEEYDEDYDEDAADIDDISSDSTVPDSLVNAQAIVPETRLIDLLEGTDRQKLLDYNDQLQNEFDIDTLTEAFELFDESDIEDGIRVQFSSSSDFSDVLDFDLYQIYTIFYVDGSLYVMSEQDNDPMAIEDCNTIGDYCRILDIF